MAVGLLPPVFRFMTDRVIGLPPDLASMTNVASALLLPWPAAIGYRRFYQGILVRHHQPRRVAYGTVVRLVTMSIAAAGLAMTSDLPGACIGSLSLCAGVLAEAGASRWMARGIVARLMSGGDSARSPLTLGDIRRFYVPLALTSLLAIAVNPLITFFLGRSRSPIESLAVLPVVMGLVFIFRSGAIAYQEVAVALSGGDRRRERMIARVALQLAGASAVALGGVLFTPLGLAWFTSVAGLSPQLAAVAIWPARLLALVPALDYMLCLQRALLVLARRTRVITAATAVEAVTIGVVLTAGIGLLDVVGATAAAAAVLTGRLGGNLYLVGRAQAKIS
jgi:hypothetical protein